MNAAIAEKRTAASEEAAVIAMKFLRNRAFPRVRVNWKSMRFDLPADVYDRFCSHART